MPRTARAALALVVLAAACKDGPTTPRPYHKPQFYPLEVSCVTVPQLRCTAFRFNEGHITHRVSWSAADSFQLAMDRPVTPSATVDFPTAGVPRILAPGAVYIRADYTAADNGFMKAVAPFQYIVAPGEPAIPAAYITGNTGVGGALVEILDGEGAGRTLTTREDNPFFIMDFFRLERPFTVRASKPGYEPDVQQHPGITVGPSNYPTRPTLRFTLRKLE